MTCERLLGVANRPGCGCLTEPIWPSMNAMFVACECRNACPPPYSTLKEMPSLFIGARMNLLAPDFQPPSPNIAHWPARLHALGATPLRRFSHPVVGNGASPPM